MGARRDAALSTAVDTAYVAATDRARRTVAAAYDLVELPASVLRPEAASRYRVVWQVSLEDETLPVAHLLIAVPWTFADELPDVYVPETVTRDGARIPHLDRFGQLCTFDDSGAFPNPDQPGEAVCAVIERAVQLLREGVAGTNIGDYADEFEAYWRDGAARPLAAIADVAATGPHRRIVVLPFVSPLGLYTRLFAESDAAAIAFAEAIGRAPEKPAPEPALYLHLDAITGAPNFTTNADAYRLVGRTAGAREALLAFLRDVPRPSRVLFSLPIANDRVFGAWVHPRYGTDINRGKHSHRVMGQVRGFRPGHLTPQVELTSVCAGLVVDRVVVRRADAARLALRTAGATVVSTDSPSVNVIGCGSLGGFVADTVRQIVPARLRLADPEDMEVHNVPRHLCDLTAVGTNKAHAVRTAIRRSDPHVEIEAYDKDVLELLRATPQALTGATHTFVATAAIAVERRLNALARELDLGTVVYLWIEPHAIAGHAVVVPGAGRGCFECLLDAQLHMNVWVLADPEQYERADAGCRGAYVPYSGLDAQMFARTITRTALAVSGDRPRVLTWVGDIDRARREGWKLSDGWVDAAAFTMHDVPLVPRTGCATCGLR
jgi:hypothetical protein